MDAPAERGASRDASASGEAATPAISDAATHLPARPRSAPSVPRDGAGPDQPPADAASDAATTSELIAEDEFARAQANAECALAESCCLRAGADHVPGNGCRDTLSTVFSLRTPATTSGARYDAQSASRCIEELEARDCTLAKLGRSDPQACKTAYRRGNVSIGERCTTYWECAQPEGRATTCARRALPGMIAEEVCAYLVLVGVGESCANTQDESIVRCEPGLYCDDGICVRPGELGGACAVGIGLGDTCAVGAVCQRTAGICAAPVPVGEACERPEDCEDLRCDEGLCREPFASLALGLCTW